MLRRSLPYHHKLVVVESPNKVLKISTFLNSGKGIEDWSFGHGSLASVAKTPQEKVTVIPTIGHFMELKTVLFTPQPSPTVAPVQVPVTPPPAVTVDATGKQKKGKKKPAKLPEDAAPAIVDVALFSDTCPLREMKVQWVPTTSKANTAASIVECVKSYGGNLTEIILASDPDREGELIASHVALSIREELPSLKVPFSRAYIHSITEDGVQKAMQDRQLHFLDHGLAAAAETRHVMDRFFGFLGSSVVRHVNPSFRSIGRVQTPALIAIAEREQAIAAYLKDHKASFSIQAKCSFRTDKGSGNAPYERVVTLTEIKAGSEANAVAQVPPLPQEKMDDAKAVEAHGAAVKEVYLKALQVAKVSKLEVDPKSATTWQLATAPPLPFTMATLISKANRTMKMSSDDVAKCLQELFQSGLITYPRTDSHRIDESVLPSIYAEIEATYGKTFVRTAAQQQEAQEGNGKGSKKKPAGAKKKVQKKKALPDGNAEDAHESIRPTDIRCATINASFSDARTGKLYDMIRATTLAAFMTPMLQDKASCQVRFTTGSGAELSLKLEAKKLTHVGFQAAFQGPDGVMSATSANAEAADDATADDSTNDDASFYDAILALPKRINNCNFKIDHATVNKSKPNPPPQHSEGSLIEYLKANGVGRPSTYPSIMKTLNTRGYVLVNAKAKLETTQVGRELVAATQKAFPTLVDIGFTAAFEQKLDRIARSVQSAGEEASNLVLSAFLIELLRMVKSTTESRRKSILERSLTARLRTSNPQWDATKLSEEVSKGMQGANLNVSDLCAQTARCREFSEVQRLLDAYLRREFPNY